jgi:hypothetical protein
MRSVDGRVPALEESFAKMLIGAANPLFDSEVVPWGNALWLNLATMKTQPHTARCEKPAKAKLAGVLKFEQGWQTGNSVINWGLPNYSRGTVIRDGLVGYKVALPLGGDADDYYAYLRGDESKDVAGVRTVYDDWMTTLQGGSDGSNLGLFFDTNTGFPIVLLVSDVKVLSGTPGATYNQADFSEVTVDGAKAINAVNFGGFAKIFEPENQAIYFDLKL